MVSGDRSLTEASFVGEKYFTSTTGRTVFNDSTSWVLIQSTIKVAPQQTTLGASTRVTPLTTMSREAQDRIAEDSKWFSPILLTERNKHWSIAGPKKKRSILSFNRRRTSEVRMGSDGKLITNG